jgi:hypothetical protein
MKKKTARKVKKEIKKTYNRSSRLGKVFLILLLFLFLGGFVYLYSEGYIDFFRPEKRKRPAKIPARIPVKIREKIREKIPGRIPAKIREKIPGRTPAKILERIREKIQSKNQSFLSRTKTGFIIIRPIMSREVTTIPQKTSTAKI